MKQLIALILLSVSLASQGQIQPIETTYTSFNRKIIDVYLIEGKNVVLNIDKTEITKEQLSDISVLQDILKRCDDLYQFYKDNLQYEPVGGNPKYSYKANVFFGSPSCGSGCGLVGAKGIEVSGFKNIFFNIKHKLNVNRDVIIGYEFGRNFFTFSRKILFPYDPAKNELNGGFAEAFANLFYTAAYEQILSTPGEKIFSEVLLNKKWAYTNFIGYINDTIATPYNTIAKADLIGVRDPNRGFDGWNCDTKSWDAYAILEGIFSVVGKNKLFPRFFIELKKLPDVITREDAMSNIAIAASYASNTNLNSFFKNVVKFKLNKNAEDLIKALPAIESKLIKYEPQLWFISPFHSIRLNLRSTNYIDDNYNYKIYLGKSLISSSKSGNNEIKYDILQGKNEATLLCVLTDNENRIVDSFLTKISKRHNINLFQYSNDWYAYYLSNASTKSFITQNGEFALENVVDTMPDNGLLFYNLIIPKGRILSFSAEVKNIGQFTPGIETNYSSAGYFSAVNNTSANFKIGYEKGQNDPINFYKISGRDYTDLHMCQSNLYMLRLGIYNLGNGVKSYFRNYILRDETDSDLDGIVDFEDPCPKSLTSKPLFDKNQYIFCSGDSLKLSITNTKKGDTLKWYYGNNIDLNDTKEKTFKSSASVYVVKTDSIGCSISSDTVQVIKRDCGLSIDGYIFMYPNPTSSYLKVNYVITGVRLIDLEFIDNTGREVLKKLNIPSGENINLNSLPSGTYIIKARQQSGQYITNHKLIKL